MTFIQQGGDNLSELCTKVQRCLLTFGSSVRLVSKGAALVPPTNSSHAKISPVAMKLPAWLDQVVQGSLFTVPPHFQHRNEKQVAANLFQEISNVKELPVISASFSSSLYWIWGGIVKESPLYNVFSKKIMYSHLNQSKFLNHYSWLFAEVNLKYSRCPCGRALLLPQRGPWDRLTRRTQGLPCIKCLQGEFLEDEGILISSCST